MEPIVIALVGAGSRSFGPETVRDVLLSEALTQHRIKLRLMDIVADNLSDIGHYAKSLAEKLGRNSEVSTTTALEAALEGAQLSSRPSRSSEASIGHRTTTSRANMGSARFSPRTAGPARSSMPSAP